MEKKGGFITYFTLLIIMSTSLVYADIFLTQQPKDIYNIGDELSVILGSDGSTGWASMNLVCGNSSEMIYFHYMSKSETNLPVNIPLTKEFLKGAKGNCYISMVFNGIEKKSFPFIISDEISISVNIDKTSLYPNESFSFEGLTKKANGQEFKGIVDVRIDSVNIQNSFPVEKNKFKGTFSFPGDIPSGSYKINFYVFERSVSGEVINSGSFFSDIKVLQKPTNLVIESPTSIIPGNPVNFKADLFDQSNSSIVKKPVALTLSDPSGKKVFDKLSFTGEINSYNLLTSSPYGSWKLEAISEGLITSSTIFVEKFRAANFSIYNSTAIIHNIGNVPFDKPVEIKIGNYTETKYLNLSVGGYIEFLLEAPDGNYEIVISDGDTNLVKSISLTGNAVSIRDKNYKNPSGFKLSGKNFLAWILLILVFGSFIFITAQKFMGNKLNIPKQRSISLSNKPEEKGGVIKISPGNSGSDVLSNKKTSSFFESSLAEHSLAIHGERQSATLLAIKIKNMSSFDTKNSNINERINEITKEISKNKGKIYRSNDFIIGIFAPVITRTFDNSLNVIKSANMIANKIKSDNNKFNQKIDFGISVCDGEIVAKNEDGKLVFTPLGSGFTNAKKIAEVSKGEVLISESTNKKVTPKVKTVLNPEQFGIKTYSIKEIVDKEENRKFIEGFLKRNNELKQLRDFRLDELKRDFK